MTPNSKKFRRKKEEAIAALLSQRTIDDAARVAGVGAKTLLRWLKVAEFVAEYREARRQAVSQATARSDDDLRERARSGWVRLTP